MDKHKPAIIKILFIGILVLAVFFLLRGPSFLSKYKLDSISNLIEDNVERNYSGASLVNLDDDEDKEIFLSVISGENIFLKYRDGKFQRIKIPELKEEGGETFSVTACDLDQDGRDEILIINSDPLNSKIMKFKNGLWFNLLSDNKILLDLSKSYSATCIDRKGNNFFGLAVVSENGPIQYLELQDSKVVNIASQIGLNLSSEGRSVIGVPGPSGFTNIFVGNKNGSNFYFLNKQDGTFSENATDYGIADKDFETRGISLIDINHDDLMDLVYGNHIGPLRLMRQERSGHFVDVTPESLVENYAVNATVVGDFNLDGYEDIYLNNSRSKNELFARSEKAWFEIDLNDKSEKDMFGVSSVVGDLDNNGSYELLNTHGDGLKFPLTLYTFQPQSEYIKIQVKLPNGGVPRGATVKLRTSSRDRVKAVSSGSGRFANYDDILIFGLFKNEKVISVEIVLPSGEKWIKNQDLKNSQLNVISL